MKIVQQTSTKLTIRDGSGSPGLFGSILIVLSLIFMLLSLPIGLTIAIAGLLIILFIEEIFLSCDTTLSKVTLKRKSLVSTKVIMECPIQEIREVQVEEYSGLGYDSPQYGVNISLLTGEQFPLLNFSTMRREDTQKVVDCIRTYITL